MKKLSSLLLAGLLTACANDGSGPALPGSGGSDANSDGVNRAALLTNLVDNQILAKLGTATTPAAGTLLAETAQLSTGVSAYCAAINTPTEAATKQTAESSWRSTMAVWQQIQMAQVAPLFDPNSNGALINRIYAWPAVKTNSCRVYQGVVDAFQNQANYDLSTGFTSQRGLGATELVLFAENLDFQCPDDSPQKQAWALLSDQDKKQALCFYAGKAVEDTDNAAKQLVNNINSGTTKADFIADTAVAEQAFVDALFNLEVLTKDAKLGIPTGLKSDCVSVSCPEEVESRLSANSIANIRGNIQGFLRAFTGDELAAIDAAQASADTGNLGFDDILEARLNKVLSDKIIDDLQALDTKFAAFSGTLEAGVTGISEADCNNSAASTETNVVAACSLFGELKAVTDLLKTDFVGVVQLNIPSNAAGDGD